MQDLVRTTVCRPGFMLLKVTLLTAPPELTEKLYFPNNVKEANLKIDTLWINKAKSLDCADLFSETFPYLYIWNVLVDFGI